MNLKQALILSLASHLLLFGGAAAFGLLAGSGSSFTGDTMLVTLVGGEKTGPAKQGRHESTPLPQEIALAPVPSSVFAPYAGDAEHSAHDESENRQDSAETADGHTAGIPSGGIGLVSPEEWRLIQAAIERAKSYPRLARERGIQGVVHVRFRVAKGGTVDDVQVVRSSGSAILDSASVKTVYRASPLPYVKGWVEVPMAYVLK